MAPPQTEGDPASWRIDASREQIQLYLDVAANPRQLDAAEAKELVELVDAWRAHEHRKHIALEGASEASRSVSSEAVAATVDRFLSAVENNSLTGLRLLLRLRMDLADLCALGFRYGFVGAAPPGFPTFSYDPEAVAEATIPELIQRFPSEIYWSGLLPLTWATVGDVGVRHLSDEVGEAYAHSKYVATAWEATDDDQMRRYIWNTTFSIFIAPRALHALAVVHEVAEDLQMYERNQHP